MVNLCVGLRLLYQVQLGFQSLIAHSSGSIVERIPKLAVLLAFEFEFLLALTKQENVPVVKPLSALNLVSLQVSPSD